MGSLLLHEDPTIPPSSCTALPASPSLPLLVRAAAFSSAPRLAAIKETGAKLGEGMERSRSSPVDPAPRCRGRRGYQAAGKLTHAGCASEEGPRPSRYEIRVCAGATHPLLGDKIVCRHSPEINTREGKHPRRTPGRTRSACECPTRGCARLGDLVPVWLRPELVLW